MTTFLATLLLASLPGHPLQDAPSGAELRPALTVTALANEGFLIECEGRAVLIDAFLAEPYSGYAALPAQVLDDLIALEPPFDAVRLALVSHVHRDHFQPEPAKAFLAANGDCLLASSPQVVDPIRAPLLEAGVPETSLVSLLPEPGASAVVERDGIRVEVLRLSHGPGRFGSIQNLGHVIELGGWRVLHVGDAEIERANFEPYALAQRGIDVALLPYWYFESAQGRALIEGAVGGATKIACHVPPDELEEITGRFEAQRPEVLVPRAALERRVFGAAAPALPSAGGR